MFEENAYLEPLENAKEALLKITNFLNIQYTNNECLDDGVVCQVSHLDPISDVNQIEVQRIIKNRQEALHTKVEAYTKEFVDLQQRIKYPQTKKVISTLSDFVNSFISGSSSAFPSDEELFLFFEKVFKAASLDYGKNFDASVLFDNLISEVKKLALAVGVSLKLRVLDETLKVYPLENLNQKEDELLQLYQFYETSCRGYFVDLGSLDHTLNSVIWLNITSQLNRDIKILKEFSDKFNHFTLAIENTKVEEDLPSDESIRETELLIDEKLAYVNSSRHAGLRIEFRKIKDAKEKKIQDVINQAQLDFKKYIEQFKQWEEITTSIEKEFSNKGKSAFPWHFFPPSQAEVRQLQEEIAQRRELYKAWPCTESVISKKNFELKNYQRILVLMNEMTLDKINEAFSQPNFSIKTIQSYIKMYKQLLYKGGYLDADERISEIELRLFSFAHKQHRNQQWFSFFRRSYFDNLSNVSWTDVAANMNGSNYGYTGARTEAVLIDLGWLRKGALSSIAPLQLKEDFIEIQYQRGLV